MEPIKENVERMLELLVYSLVKNTEIYNHELATNTLNAMENIIYDHLEETTDELTKRLLYYWNNMDKNIENNCLFKGEV